MKHLKVLPAVILATVLPVLAACSGSTRTVTRPGPAVTRTVTVSATPSSPSPAPLSSQSLPANVTLAPSAGLPPGPFDIKALSCGPITLPQDQGQDVSGLLFRYVNKFNDLVAAPMLTVNFLRGSTVVANNVSAGSTVISPGQSAVDEVDSLNDSGGRVSSFTSCQIVSYTLTGNNVAGTGTYAP